MIKDRNGNILPEQNDQERFLTFLYCKKPGRLLLRLLCRRWISNLGGAYMRSRLSRGRINRLISGAGIDMSEYPAEEYRSFNEFFTRRILPEKRVVCTEKNAVVSPADSKLTVYDITANGKYIIKGGEYDILTLLGGDGALAGEFTGGKMFVYRLTVDNYHRYCFTDGGRELVRRFIPGVLHTVNPIATERTDVFGKNCRELTLLETDSFGRVAVLEIGAMMVGRINNAPARERVERGEEKGYFSFGGSTVVLLYRAGTAVPDEDIAKNSASGVETAVKYGERTGCVPGTEQVL